MTAKVPSAPATRKARELHSSLQWMTTAIIRCQAIGEEKNDGFFYYTVRFGQHQRTFEMLISEDVRILERSPQSSC